MRTRGGGRGSKKPENMRTYLMDGPQDREVFHIRGRVGMSVIRFSLSISLPRGESEEAQSHDR